MQIQDLCVTACRQRLTLFNDIFIVVRFGLQNPQHKYADPDPTFSWRRKCHGKNIPVCRIWTCSDPHFWLLNPICILDLKTGVQELPLKLRGWIVAM
jgi:hypothetical protein